MARRKRGTPEQQARRELISELLSAANVQSMDDIQNLFKETIAEFMETFICRDIRYVAAPGSVRLFGIELL